MKMLFLIVAALAVFNYPMLGIARAERDVQPMRSLPMLDVMRTPVFPANELVIPAALPTASLAPIPALKKPNLFIRLLRKFDGKPELRLQFGKPEAIR